MPSFKYVIELSDQDKATLMEIVKKGNSPARTILRANILLASDKRNDKYMTVSEIADAYRTTPTTVQTVRTSYCEKGLEATINRKKRETPPIPAKVTGYQKALDNQKAGNIKIISHANVARGNLYYDRRDMAR